MSTKIPSASSRPPRPDSPHRRTRSLRRTSSSSWPPWTLGGADPLRGWSTNTSSHTSTSHNSSIPTLTVTEDCGEQCWRRAADCSWTKTDFCPVVLSCRLSLCATLLQCCLAPVPFPTTWEFLGILGKFWFHAKSISCLSSDLENQF